MYSKWKLLAALTGIYITIFPAGTVIEAAEDAAKIEFFEKSIRPLLANNCYNCHSTTTNSQGGLRIDDRNALLTGGRRGAAIVPGNPDSSLLIKAVTHQHDVKMPPKSKLSDEQIAHLKKWITDGAAWPAPKVPDYIGKANPKFEQLKREHWAWQPLKRVGPPPVQDRAWPLDEIDRFLLAKLEAAGLQPVRAAGPAELVRRLSFDLTGLPPSPELIDEFTRRFQAEGSSAYEELVDRMLASSAFGERWGRHWLDVARYAESTGSARNLPYPHAWRYRDYVIDSFNADKPYDQFIREQIAGDLLPYQSQQQHDERVIATGFLAIGVKDVNQRYKVRFIMDNIDEQIDTVSRSVLALTASCARCHDHKFDPISTTEYYALAGIFHSSDLCAGLRNKMGGGGLDYYDTAMLVPLPTGARAPDPKQADKIEQLKKDVEQARLDFEKIRGTPEGLAKQSNGRPKQFAYRQKWQKLQQDLLALTDPAANGGAALGMRDAKVVGDTEIRIRGEAEALGPVVPRGFLSLVQVPGAPKIGSGSGRLELAEWLTSPHNALAQRVIVNRIWQHLFGRGLVSSVDNFGVTGDLPSHPELLDHLAARFVDGGWSIKALVRNLVLTRAYQLSSDSYPAAINVDPSNRLLWRHAPRRLEAEEIRDGMLAVAGRLDRTRPEASPAKDLRVIELRNNGPEARQITARAQTSVQRSVYLPLLRGITPHELEVFDFAEQGMVTGARDTTTVATQALFLLNDAFVRRQALALAERVLGNTSYPTGDKISLAYRLTLGRSPSGPEIDRAKAYLADYEKDVKPLLVASATKTNKPETSPIVEEKSAPVIPVNPDDIDPSDAPVKEESVEAADPELAAWMSFCQALLGSAEFRYLK